MSGAFLLTGLQGWSKGLFGDKGQVQLNNRKEGGMQCLKSMK